LISSSFTNRVNPLSRYRKFDAIGNKQVTNQIKRRETPSFVSSVLLYEGKGHRNIIGLTDLCYMDIDHLNEEQINEVMKSLSEDEHVVLAFRSMSGKGIHFFVKYRFKNMEQPQITTMSPKRMVETYFAVFNTLSLQYTNILHLSIDESGRNAVQSSNISYDEELYYNPQAIPYSLIYEPQKAGNKQALLRME